MSGLGWCSECGAQIFRFSASLRNGTWFGPCGHQGARILREKPIRWKADTTEETP